MAFCGNCGTKVEDGKKFCPECGTVMEAKAPQQQPQPQQQAPQQPQPQQQAPQQAQPQVQYQQPVQAQPAPNAKGGA
ncbi:MAG: zinc-ribbon domain-containing protein, partial [Clostridia bacterium]|nr:zinc-ribbon domain-containing protein [Clostridia bacterium]